MPKDIDDLINSLGKLSETIRQQMLQDAENASQSIKQTGTPSRAALEQFIKSQRDYAKAIADATKAQKSLNAANNSQQGNNGLGRLPLASIGAALLGNKAAGARVGYALGNLLGGRGVQGGGGKGGGPGGPGGALGAAAGGMGRGGAVGLGAGLLAAGAVGAGMSASPIGREVITKPLEILGATIGGVVLPALVVFGGALIDFAVTIQPIVTAFMPLAERAAAVVQTLSEVANFSLAPPKGSYSESILSKIGLADPNAPPQGADNLGKVVSGFFSSGPPRGGYIQRALQAVGLSDTDEEFARKQETKAGKKQGGAEMIISAMKVAAGGTPKIGGNLADIAKDVQQAAFGNPIQRLLELIYQGNIQNSEKIVKAVKGE